MSASNDNIASLSDELNAELDENGQTQLVDPRLMPVHFTSLKLMSLSAAHYYSACQRRSGDYDSIALRLGSGVHAMVLDQPVVKYPARRAGKAWDAFEADNADKVILNPREWDEARKMSSAILCHREAMRLLFEDTIVEQPIAWEYLGRACSSRPDACSLKLGNITELKTARTAKPAWFVREGLRMHYHAQVAFYAEAIESHYGARLSNAYIVAVEKTEPFPVTVMRVTDRALEAGRRLNRLWFEQLLACEAANTWPGYSESIIDFDVPENDNIELEIDGKLVEVAGW